MFLFLIFDKNRNCCKISRLCGSQQTRLPLTALFLTGTDQPYFWQGLASPISGRDWLINVFKHYILMFSKKFLLLLAQSYLLVIRYLLLENFSQVKISSLRTSLWKQFSHSLFYYIMFSVFLFAISFSIFLYYWLILCSFFTR